MRKSALQLRIEARIEDLEGEIAAIAARRVGTNEPVLHELRARLEELSEALHPRGVDWAARRQAQKERERA